MRFADLVAASRQVAATTARSEKIRILAGLIRRLSPGEIAPAVWFLAGGLRQGRVKVGFRQAFGTDTSPAPDPNLSITDVDAAFAMLDQVGGPGSQHVRHTTLIDLFARATADEQEFLRRLLIGEVRQGASEGIVVEAVAAAAEVPSALVRRALMLTGDLGETARIALTEGADGLAAVQMRVMTPIKPMLASRSTDSVTTWRSSPATSTRSPAACPTYWRRCGTSTSRRWCRTGKRWPCDRTAAPDRSRRR